MTKHRCPACETTTFLHHLGCPVLERILLLTVAGLCIATLILTLTSLAGGPSANYFVFGPLILFFAAYLLLSRSKSRDRRRNPPE